MFAGLLTAMACLAGCKQSEGGRCEIDMDCKAGLRCENPFGAGGQCTAENVRPIFRLDGGARDTAPATADAAATDVSVDAAPDAGLGDSSNTVDVPARDASPADVLPDAMLSPEVMPSPDAGGDTVD
jgi:hypothetical protein